MDILMKKVDKVFQELARIMIHKGKVYGDSWKQRGGVGAFMMLARKWDRIENQCAKEGYDIFKVLALDTGVDGIKDDVKDLCNYLLLVLSEIEFSEKSEQVYRAELDTE